MVTKKKSAQKVSQKSGKRPDRLMSAGTVHINPAALHNAVMYWTGDPEQEKRYSQSWKRKNWQTALGMLDMAIGEQKIYNQELEFVKSALSNGIELALDHVLEEHYDKWRGKYDRMPYEYRDLVNDAVSSYCGFNQAAGRIRRLEKKPIVLKELPEIAGYIEVLKDIAAIWEAIVALKPFVIKGRKPLENPKPVDLTNTGTCAICFNRQKLLQNKNMVHHGFQISDGYGHYFGFRNGACFGCKYKPYELSNAGNIAFKAHLEAILQRTQESLARHKSGEITTLTEKRWTRVDGQRIEKLFTVKIGEEGFDRLMAKEIREHEWAIDSLKRDIERQQLLIDTWTLKPLPGDVPVVI